MPQSLIQGWSLGFIIGESNGFIPTTVPSLRSTQSMDVIEVRTGEQFVHSYILCTSSFALFMLILCLVIMGMNT
jgi:hypothetical protein